MVNVVTLLAETSCYGCGVCSISCPKDIISIQMGEDGFYHPTICNVNKCVECGICIKNCAYLNDFSGNSVAISGFGAWSNNPQIRMSCSSGGAGYEIAKYLLSIGYKVIAVRYNVQTNLAEHYIASEESDLRDSIGSKYIQSNTVGALSQIVKDQKYLFIGTPCQVASFRRWLSGKAFAGNFVLMDFFCHGVPSYNLWNKYLVSKKDKTGKITFASWRNKLYGWHDSWAICLDGDNSQNRVCRQCFNGHNLRECDSIINSKWSEGDIFYQAFLGHFCLNEACTEHCKFKKTNSSADIRIGDFWGDTYARDEEGVSSILVYSDIGKEVVENADLFLEEQAPDVVTEGQMSECARPAFLNKLATRVARKPKTTINHIRIIIKTNNILLVPRRFLRLIKRHLSK